MYTFKFADIGEGLHEGVVAEIYVKVGQQVKEGDNLFSVETDKVTSDIPSPVSGTITAIKMAQGDTIHVGQDIFVFDDGKGDAPVAEAPAPKAEAKDDAASVVGEVKVNNDLIDFSKMFSGQPAPKAEEVKPSAAPAPSAEDKTFDEGKKYTGKVDESYDVIVVGSGPGGYLAAEEAGKAGLKTLIVEKKYWGGVCLNTGCIPTKTLLKSADVISYLEHAADYGIVAEKAKIDFSKSWVKMHQRKADVVKKISSSVEMLMKMSKVTSVFGEAKFVGARALEVNGKVYEAKNVILATGSTANKLLKVPGFESGYKSGEILTSEEAINFDKKLPKKVTIVGGGVIGIEFANVFAKAGSKVTVVQNGPVLLPGMDSDVSKLAKEMLEGMGVEVLLNANTLGYEKKTLKVEVDSKTLSLKQDVVLTAIGRSANAINAAEVGVKLGERGEVLVDSLQRTNVAGVYAIGDVTNQKMLAHVAYAHALVAVFHILGDKQKGSYHPKAVPGCVYTSPEIAFIGMTEAEAKAQGRNVMTAKYSFANLGKAIASNKTKGLVKLVVDKEFGEILGAWMVGENVTDYIAEVAMAMENEISVHEIAHTIHPHPTYNEMIWEAARSASLTLTLAAMKK